MDKRQNKKGKTYEEYFGKEKAKEIKLLLSKVRKGTNKNKTYEERYGKERAKLIKEKISNSQKGKTYQERYGKERANKLKLKLSQINKGKTYEERYGKERAKLIKEKIIKTQRIWTKKKIINNLLKIIQKIGLITRSELSELYKNYNICNAELIRLRFGSLDNLVLEGNINFKLPSTRGRRGINETKILNKIEEKNNIILLRQYQIAGKFIDGYDKENNVAYEIDEWHHKYKKVEDIIRENNIKEILGCKFVRIND